MKKHDDDDDVGDGDKYEKEKKVSKENNENGIEEMIQTFIWLSHRCGILCMFWENEIVQICIWHSSDGDGDRRSNNNKLYWWWVSIGSDETGSENINTTMTPVFVLYLFLLYEFMPP